MTQPQLSYLDIYVKVSYYIIRFPKKKCSLLLSENLASQQMALFCLNSVYLAIVSRNAFLIERKHCTLFCDSGLYSNGL